MSKVAQRTPAPPGVLVPMPSLDRAHAGPMPRPAAGAGAPQGLELRHLRYFVAVADTGTFTRAAERLFIAQPTLGQQIRRLEEIVGTPLLRRRRDGLQLTAAGRVLLTNAVASVQSPPPEGTRPRVPFLRSPAGSRRPGHRQRPAMTPPTRHVGRGTGRASAVRPSAASDPARDGARSEAHQLGPRADKDPL